MQIEFKKKYLVLVATCFCSLVSAQSSLWLDFEEANDTIQKELYGALMENWGRGIYTGVYVGEASSIPNTDGIRNDVIEAFKEAGITCVDWPGGCFAERYRWLDGIGPKHARPGGDLNTNYPINSNGFGTAEYFQLCDLLGTPPYITANTTNLSPAGMTAWLNHIDSTFPGRLHYWKMGNEPWGGCPPGISITQYIQRYDNYKVAIPSQLSGKLFRIADGGSGNGTPSIWLDSLMRFEMGSVEGVTYHYYTGLNGSGPSYDFSVAQYNERMKLAWAMENNMVTCERIMDKYDPENTVGLMVDEWGAWYTEIPNMGFTYQQNTCRDAVIASMHLNIFNNHCRRVKMAMVAQPVNVIQALLLTQNPPTTDIIKTPTFYVFKMYKVHQDAKMIPVTLNTGNTDGVPYITASASVDSAGVLHISMCNTHVSDEQLVSVVLRDAPGYDSCTATIINGPEYKSYNDYGGVEPVNIQPLAEGHLSSFDGSSFKATLPAHSVVTFALTPSVTVSNRQSLQNRMNHGHGVWSVKSLLGGKIHLRTSASEAVPVTLTLLGIDGKTVITSDYMTITPGASGSTWQPIGKNHYYSGVYILRITMGKETTAFRVVLSN